MADSAHVSRISFHFLWLYFKRVKIAHFALLMLKLLFKLSLLLNFKSNQNFEFMCLNLCILNLLPTMKKDVTANQENLLEVLAFSYALERIKYLIFLLSNSKFQHKVVVFSIYILRKLKRLFKVLAFYFFYIFKKLKEIFSVLIFYFFVNY